ncbi:hypothetical protein ABIA30_001502 [Mycobacterium sp. MAA66]|uniref:hypothetical protein n=1 Tax=Mycobacterium sp. MAA66 TaxID=3156297 RepID=UPI00351897BE
MTSARTLLAADAHRTAAEFRLGSVLPSWYDDVVARTDVPMARGQREGSAAPVPLLGDECSWCRIH